MTTESDLQKTEDLHGYLRNEGGLKEGPAWTVIWYLGNLYWKVPEVIESDGDQKKAVELYEFLQGIIPDTCSIPVAEVPRMARGKARDTVRHLGTLDWQVTDVIERCSNCGSLFDSENEGELSDGDEGPLCSPECRDEVADLA